VTPDHAETTKHPVYAVVYQKPVASLSQATVMGASIQNQGICAFQKSMPLWGDPSLRSG
jgi:hypothetical protein